MGKVYGYIRALADGQDVDKQIVKMREMQVMDRDIFIDRQEDAADACKSSYRRLLQKLEAGDLLYMKNLDSLGNDYGEIGRQWRKLTKEKKADVVVLDLPHVDTRQGKQQCDTLVEDIVLVMLEYYADTEQAARGQKRKEGIEEAGSRGVCD